ncbi:MAG: S-layer homology domain-containing protein [bacterium]
MQKWIKVLGAGLLALSFVVRPAHAGVFPDVPTDHWAYDAVEYLTSKGYVEGYPDGEFKGNRMLTRYEYAMIIARLERKLLEELKGAPGDILAMVEEMRDQFRKELDDIYAKLANHEMRITDLEGKVTDLGERTTAVETKVADHDRILAALKKIDWSGDLGTEWLWGTGGKFAPDQPDHEQSDLSYWFALAMRIPINDKLDIHTKVTTLGPQGVTCTGPTPGTSGERTPCYEKFDNYNGVTTGLYDPFRTGDYRLPSNNSQTNATRLTNPTNQSFDLNEAYLTWAKDWGDMDKTVFRAGKFNPFWLNSELFFNPYSGYEGIGFTWDHNNAKWKLTLQTLRTENFTALNLPTLDDVDLMMAIWSSEGRALRRVDLIAGYAMSTNTDITDVVAESPEVWMFHIAYDFPHKKLLKAYASWASNGEDLRKTEEANYGSDEFAISFMLGIIFNELKKPHDWSLDVSFKSVGLNNGLPSYYVPDSKFTTFAFSYLTAKNTKTWLRVDTGKVGNQAGLQQNPTILTVSTGIDASF